MRGEKFKQSEKNKMLSAIRSFFLTLIGTKHMRMTPLNRMSLTGALTFFDRATYFSPTVSQIITHPVQYNQSVSPQATS
jgi:hypothetical protein